MLRRLRETGPVVLVPLAWVFAILAHLGELSTRTVLIAHVVMTVLLVGFLVLSWNEMTEGVLRVWRTVILLGVPVTLSGVAGLVVRPRATVLVAAALVGWMLLPALALGRTARLLPSEASARIAVVGGGISLFGAVLYGAGWYLSTPSVTLVALGLVGLGQTAGIADAVYRY